MLTNPPEFGTVILPLAIFIIPGVNKTAASGALLITEATSKTGEAPKMEAAKIPVIYESAPAVKDENRLVCFSKEPKIAVIRYTSSEPGGG